MRKIMITSLMLLLLTVFFSMFAFAAEEDKTFSFYLSIDGNETKEVKTGDTITVMLKLRRTDSDKFYTMYAMQDEIRYDSTFFEYVEGSAVLNTGITTTDIAMADRYREFYMNYLSMSGGAQWDSDMLIGSFQLRVIGESGVTKITNQDFLVSMQDGSGSYKCEANDLTVILSSDCVVKFECNGGSGIDDQIVQYGEKIIQPEDPKKEGVYFDGWYSDIDHTKRWDFEKDTVKGNMTLYAKWTNEAASDHAQSAVNGKYWLIACFLVLIVMVYLAYRYTKGKKIQ